MNQLPIHTKHLLFSFIIIIGCFSCIEEKELALSEDRLIPILCDIHIAEAALLKTSGTNKDSAAVKLYSQIYEIHGVTEAELDSCLVRIKKESLLSEAIYTKVMTELEKMKLVEK